MVLTAPRASTTTAKRLGATAGAQVTFTVRTRGPEALTGEEVTYGDGGTSGANAGIAGCMDSIQVVRTTTSTHAHASAGTYESTHGVHVIGPRPQCAATVVVAPPAAAAAGG